MEHDAFYRPRAVLRLVHRDLAFDFQHEKVLYLDPSLLRQFVRPDIDQRFEHPLDVMVAEVSSPPYFRDGLIFVE